MRSAALGGATLWFCVACATPSEPAAPILPEGGAVTTPPRAPCPEVEIAEVQLLEDASVVEANFDRTELLAWITRLSHALRSSLCDMPPRDVSLLINLRVGKDIDLQLMARPELSLGEHEKLGPMIRALEAPAPEVVDFAFKVHAKVRGGSSEFAGPWNPPFVDPMNDRIEAYGRASTVDQLRFLQDWATKRILPLMARLGRQVGPEFAGVAETLERFEAIDAQEAAALARRLPRDDAYWRGVLEMARGNLMLPLGLIATLIADGQLDWARTLLQFMLPFSKPDAGFAHSELKLLSALLGVFFVVLDDRIEQGIERYDAGRIDEAVAIFEGILADHPASSRAAYELYLSQHTRGGLRAEPWSKVGPRVFALDPTFSATHKMSSGEEAFIAMRRLEIRELADAEGSLFDRLMLLAEIALDAEEYLFAAHLFWYGSVHLEDEAKRKRTGQFLYCLEALGVSSIKQFFEGDFSDTFSAIKADRETRMRKSPAYRAFGKKREGPPKPKSPGG